ncbi:protein of unknown function [Devosia lucknowensis]|uniref:DUF4893 domain-containing protein n=1 Tax=Devosia lucknowensis TaxID=1096929 RepID=A0A1Y6GC00_9HYPH|nr:DUF4893 domain-containing protein [Devosia lucknowensis]SMQ86007.1 protein of unknown function [Devosia lucknowensis]
MRTRPTKRMTLVMIAMLASQTATGMACDVPAGVEVSEADSDRMFDFFRSRSMGLAEALLSTDADARATVSGLFSGGDRYIDAIPDGKYRCRTIKLGGILPLTAYDYFACTISDGGSRIDKTSGSQRFSGTLTSAAQAVFYQGALHYGDEQPIAYGDDPERNQVGCIYRVGDDTTRRYRLELPAPMFESTHDVIELVPVK